PAAFAGRTFVGFLTAAGPFFLSAAAHFVDGSPRAPFGYAGTGAAFFVTLRDMFGLAFLFPRITRFGSAWHKMVSGPFLAKVVPRESFVKRRVEVADCNLRSR